jgi:quinol monooxygenase YgiN
MVVLRFAVASEDEFLASANQALAALAARPGYLAGQLGRAVDDPTAWCLVTHWESVGTYRRALGAYDVKVRGTPLLAQALPEVSAYEPLATAEPGGSVTLLVSDLEPGGRTIGRSDSGGQIASRP